MFAKGWCNLQSVCQQYKHLNLLLTLPGDYSHLLLVTEPNWSNVHKIFVYWIMSYHIYLCPVPCRCHIFGTVYREKNSPRNFRFAFRFWRKKKQQTHFNRKNTKKVRSDPIKNLIRQILCAMRDACWPSQSKFEGDLLLTIVAAVDKRSDSLRS